MAALETARVWLLTAFAGAPEFFYNWQTLIAGVVGQSEVSAVKSNRPMIWSANGNRETNVPLRRRFHWRLANWLNIAVTAFACWSNMRPEKGLLIS